MNGLLVDLSGGKNNCQRWPSMEDLVAQCTRLDGSSGALWTGQL